MKSDIKLPRTSLDIFSFAMNDYTSRLITNGFSTKIEVKTPLDAIDIEWNTIGCQADGCGELAAIYVWDGQNYECRSLDAHDTVGDLLDLNEELGGEL